MSRPSVCMVTNLYGDRARGGAERIVETEAEELRTRGSRVTVITATPDAPREYTAGSGIGIREVRPRNLCFYTDLHGRSWGQRLAWHVLDMWNAGAARRVGEIVSAIGPDVAHTHNLMGLGFMVPAAVRRAGVRHVHTVHDVQLLHPSGLLPPAYRRPRAPHDLVYVAAMRKLMGSPDVVAFPSEKLMTLHDTAGFFPASKKVVLRNPAPPVPDEHRTVPTAPRFLFIGQLEPHKGVRTLLDAWDDWQGRRGGARLEIAGSGSLEDEVRERTAAAHGVTFLGRLDKDGVLSALSAASHVVVPSEVIENAPASLLEAMSRGTPAVAADTGGIPELIKEGETGTLFAPGDAASLAAALDRAADLEGWGAMSAACLDAARSMTAARHVDELERLYAA